MTHETDVERIGPTSPTEVAAGGRAWPIAGRYGAALALVGLATLLAFVVEHLISAPNLTLIFVLPVVIAATSFGWGSSLAAAVGGVLAFDFFFTSPYYSFRIAGAGDIWAAALLLVVATLVSTVAARARARAVEARRAAEQAEALQTLAHAVIAGRPRGEVLEAGARTLHRIFRAPAVVFVRQDGALVRAAGAGPVRVTTADEEAARGSLDGKVPTRAQTYPFDQSRFDFWPFSAVSGESVLGVDFSGEERPAAAERLVELVGGYLATHVAKSP